MYRSEWISGRNIAAAWSGGKYLTSIQINIGVMAEASRRNLVRLSDRTAAHRVQAGRAGLTDTFASGRKSPFMKAGCGKTARPVCAADGGQRKSNRARLLRPDTCEATEQGEATPGGSRGGKGLTQGEQPLGGRGSDTEPKCRVDPNNGSGSGDVG